MIKVDDGTVHRHVHTHVHIHIATHTHTHTHTISNPLRLYAQMLMIVADEVLGRKQFKQALDLAS